MDNYYGQGNNWNSGRSIGKQVSSSYKKKPETPKELTQRKLKELRETIKTTSKYVGFNMETLALKTGFTLEELESVKINNTLLRTNSMNLDLPDGVLVSIWKVNKNTVLNLRIRRLAEPKWRVVRDKDNLQYLKSIEDEKEIIKNYEKRTIYTSSNIPSS